MRRCIGAHGGVAGLEQHDALDRLDLAQGAAREQAAIITDEITERLDQARLAIEAAGVAILHQQSGGGDCGPGGDFVELVVGLVHLPVQPARGFGNGEENARASLAVGARQDQRGVDQPGEQAVPGVADVPRRAGRGFRIGGEPCRQNTFGHGHVGRARPGGFEIGQPAEAVDQPLHRGRQAGAGKLGIGNRAAHAQQQEMPCPQGLAGGFIARQRIGDGGGETGAPALAEGVECARRQPEAIGEPGQPIARTNRGRAEIGERQRATGLDHRRFEAVLHFVEGHLIVHRTPLRRVSRAREGNGRARTRFRNRALVEALVEAGALHAVSRLSP